MKFSFWVTYLKVVSIFFSLMGVFWAVSGSFDPLGLWDTQFAQAFWGQKTLPEDVLRAKEFILGPFGATSAAYFVLQYFITKYAYAKKELWAYNSILIGFFFWFFLDSIITFYHKAYFNFFLANVPSLLAMLPIIFTRKYFMNNANA